MRTTISGLIIATILACCLNAAPDDRKAKDLLQAAQAKETIQGDLKTAIDLYRKVAKEAGSNRALAARALLLAGKCYEKLGDAEARKLYEQVVNGYGEQKETVREAQSRLSALGGGVATSGRILARQLPIARMVNGGWPTADGKLLYLGYCSGVLDLTTGVKRWLGWRQETEECSGSANGAVPSPDGRMLAYHWSETGREPEFRVADAEGRNPRTVAKAPGSVIAWTPDQRGLFVEWVTGQDKGYLDTWVRHLGMVDLGTGTVRQIFETTGGPHDFIPSNNGRWVAYAHRSPSAQKDRDVYIVSLTGGDPVLVAGGPSDDFPLSSTADGNGLLISSNRGGQSAIWGIAIADGKPRGELSLVYPSLPATKPTPLGMSRSGTLLLGASNAQRVLFEVRIDEATGKAQPSRRLETKGAVTVAPVYLPDGRTAVYNADGKLIMRDLETGKERPVEVNCGRPGGFYGVHPKTNQVLISCESRDAGGIKAGYYFVNVETGRAELVLDISPGKPMPTLPVLSGDGGRLYFTVSRRQHRSLDIATSQEREEWQDRDPFYLFSFSPDGRQMAISREGQGAEIVNLDGTVATQLPKGAHFTWSGDGRWLFFTVSEDGKGRIKRMPAAGGTPETIYEGGTIVFQGFNVHPSGNRIFVVESTFTDETWGLENIGNVSLK